MDTPRITPLEADPESIADQLAGRQRVLLLGRPGVGKSTLAASLGAVLTGMKRSCTCLGADPGSPAFGVPGAVCLAQWSATGWIRFDLEPLCSFDAGRFRLPVIQAVRRLTRRLPPGVLLIDGPGVVRGVAGAELLDGLVWAAAIDAIVVLARDHCSLPLADELHSLTVPVYRVAAAVEARLPSKRARARKRTALWDDYLRSAGTESIDIAQLGCTGTPPPMDVPAAWIGRQAALLKGGRCMALGEILNMSGALVQARLVGPAGDGDTLLVRDAQRDSNGLLTTAAPFAAKAVKFTATPDRAVPGADRPDGSRAVAQVGPFTATLVNGVFGDPLLHVRLRQRRRSLLFDLGESSRLPARIAHQVTDVFISHAHIDHIAGFLWFLRSRIATTSRCRIFGPPGIAANIAGLLAGIHWDRIGQHGPRFEVAELHGARLRRSLLQVGKHAPRRLAEASAAGGVLLEDGAFTVSAVTLDHRTPVLAFALETECAIKVRKERLAGCGWPPGPWLATLKRAIAAGRGWTAIALPDGSRRSAAELAGRLLRVRPGPKLVYATDLADTPSNRRRLEALAQGAHTVFCEAVFCEGEAAQAARTGHLTARACGEIAAAAGIEHLIPFHFSHRYQQEPGRLYAQVKAACSATVVPPDVALS